MANLRKFYKALETKYYTFFIHNKDKNITKSRLA